MDEGKPSAEDDEKTVESDFATTVGTASITIVDASPHQTRKETMQKREMATNAELTSDVSSLLKKIEELQDALNYKNRGQYGGINRQQFMKQFPDALDVWHTLPITTQLIIPVSKCLCMHI